jgi:molybdenum cofactor sulfurtransferase
LQSAHMGFTLDHLKLNKRDAAMGNHISDLHSMDTHSEDMLRTDDRYFEDLREHEYGLLDRQGHVYLDYTGGNLVPLSLLRKHHDLLENAVLGNPHSTNPTSQLAGHLVEEARAKVLNFFNAHDYFCIFTQNASASLKIVGESYPFTSGSRFVLTSDNHNSVNGIREFCNGKGGSTHYTTLNYKDLNIDEYHLSKLLAQRREGTHNLFAFPAQSNVSGIKHDLSWIEKAQQMGFDVLLDAAAYVPTSRLDLSVHKPDFVSISFYKIFGYPTGIGCLLVRKDTCAKLVKPWFAGGTVTLVSVVSQNKFLAEGNERFEDGTLNYAGIPAVTHGLEYIEAIGYERIQRRIQYLIRYLYDRLSALRHPNGADVVRIFGTHDFGRRGGNIILNFMDSDGKVIPFEQVEERANAKMISIRSGCFCNPGIDEINNCITTEEMSTYFSTHEKGDYYDMVATLGKMRGAIRVSVGLATNVADLDAFVEFAEGMADR